MKTLMRGAGFLLACVILFGMATVLTGGQLPKLPGINNDDSRRIVTMSVTQKRLRPEKGVAILINYRSTDSEWRGPIRHANADPNKRQLDPWNRSVSVRIGATVTLTANQTIANELTCIISVASTGQWGKAVTRRSIGTVTCTLLVA